MGAALRQFCKNVVNIAHNSVLLWEENAADSEAQQTQSNCNLLSMKT